MENDKECEICHIKLRAWSMRGHMLSHSGDKSFKCNVCERGFAESGNLRKHLQTHSLDESKECIVCSKMILLRHMKSHMQFHSGEKYFQCADCGLSFKRKGSISEHLKKIHNSSFIEDTAINDK